jgi:hypothetical protein
MSHRAVGVLGNRLEHSAGFFELEGVEHGDGIVERTLDVFAQDVSNRTFPTTSAISSVSLGFSTSRVSMHAKNASGRTHRPISSKRLIADIFLLLESEQTSADRRSIRKCSPPLQATRAST